MRAIIINITDNYVKTLDIKDTLETYYELINCRCIDIVERKIGGKYYDIVCDDEGLLKENNISAIESGSLDVMMVGNLVITNHDGKGNLTGLTKEDINNIYENIWSISPKSDPDYITPVLVCEY